jgi:hypothetical protein
VSPRESISSNFQSQYQLETWLMSMLYGAGAGAVLLLGLHVPTITDDNLRRVLTYAYATSFLLAASAIAGVFRYKYPSYPFRVLF